MVDAVLLELGHAEIGDFAERGARPGLPMASCGPRGASACGDTLAVDEEVSAGQVAVDHALAMQLQTVRVCVRACTNVNNKQ